MGRLLFLLFLVAFYGCNSYSISGIPKPEVPAGPVDPLIQGDRACDPGAVPFGYGDGSSSNPFRICSEEQFLNLGLESYAGINFRQTESLSFLSSTFAPLGDGTVAFEGSYDGLDHTLSDVTYSAPGESTPVGIFRFLGSASVVKNLNITNLNMTGNEETGGLAGKAQGLITEVTLSGAIVGNAHVGGLVGKQSASGLTITNSETSATVSSLGSSLTITNTDFDGRTKMTGAGGIIGTSIFDMTLRNLGSSSNVSFSLTGRGTYTMMGAGGIVGATSGKNTLVEDCHTTGIISSKFDAGGVIGTESSGLSETSGVSGNLTQAVFRRLSTAATVQGPNVIGGIIGFFNGGTLHQSYFTGTVKNKLNGGGVIGAGFAGVVTESFSAGTFSDANNTGCQAVGGFMGQIFTSVLNAPLTVSDSYASTTFNLTCSGMAGVSSFIGYGVGRPNLLFNRVASFVVHSNLTLKAFGSGGGSNPALLTNSAYYQNAAVTTESTAGVAAVTNPTDTTQYLTTLDFTTPKWRVTTVNPFADFTHPVPAWVCGLDGVHCL